MCIAVLYSMLQYITVHYSAVQSVAALYSLALGSRVHSDNQPPDWNVASSIWTLSAQHQALHCASL